jgi:hypothetical protein
MAEPAPGMSPSVTKTIAGIFISYRHVDTDTTFLLQYWLKEHFGQGLIFWDKQDISPGAEWFRPDEGYDRYILTADLICNQLAVHPHRHRGRIIVELPFDQEPFVGRGTTLQAVKSRREMIISCLAND